MKFKDLEIGKEYAFCPSNDWLTFYEMKQRTHRVLFFDATRYSKRSRFSMIGSNRETHYAAPDGTYVKVKDITNNPDTNGRECFVLFSQIRRDWDSHSKDYEERFKKNSEHKISRYENANKNRDKYGEDLVKFFELIGDKYSAKEARRSVDEGISEPNVDSIYEHRSISEWNKDVRSVELNFETISRIVRALEGK